LSGAAIASRIETMEQLLDRVRELIDENPILANPWVLGVGGVVLLIAASRVFAGRGLTAKLVVYGLIGAFLAGAGALYLGAINRQLGGEGELATPAEILERAKNKAQEVSDKVKERNDAIERELERATE
jgi:hypothetical protein